MTAQLTEKELKQFRLIAGIAKDEAGLAIPAEKASMVFSRVSKRIRELGLTDMDAYCRILQTDNDPQERTELITRLTTNVTSFFREEHHFKYLRETVLPDLIKRTSSGGRLRIWSAGCSTGPEPYCLAMTLLDLMPQIADYDALILATDIDREVLKTARTGVYPESQLATLNPDQKRAYFKPSEIDGHLSAAPILRKLIRFNQLNLLHDWPMRQPFDVIFCRNVLIYFDQDTQDSVIKRFAACLHPDSHLMLGHSERVGTKIASLFDTLGNTIYRRVATPPSKGA